MAEPVTAPGQTTAEPVDMRDLRGAVRNVVCSDAMGMVEATIQQAHKGHYQAMKCLFEMIGLFPATATPDVPQEDSLAAMLLTRLGMAHEPVAQEHENQGTKAGVPPGTP
jgi:hypothetical protein